MMGVTKYSLFRILDAVLLSTVFVFQSVILVQYTVYSQYHSELPSDYVNPIYQKLLWLVGDFVCLTTFLLACLCGFKHVSRKRAHSGNDINTTSRIPTDDIQKNSLVKYISSSKIPLCYISWFMYASVLVVKICMIFTSSLNDKWREAEHDGAKVFFGPQVLQLALGMSAVIFSLLVEAHHNAGKKDPTRNAYLNSVSYEVALEVLDTACLLSFLITTFEHEENHGAQGEKCPSVILTPPIITLSAINLILPTVTLYKLTSTNFGETYHVKLEMIYKTLHLLLVNLPFFAIRVHLWNKNDREDVIFIIKNVYGIFGYFRGVYSDVKILLKERAATGAGSINKGGSMISVNNRRNDLERRDNADSVEMKELM